MQYNIHPIFVHFPIALLFIYSIIKILPLRKWWPTFAWKDIERILLVCGVAGAFVALATGELAEHLAHPNRQIVEYHSLFADITTWLYGSLLLGEIAAFVHEKITFVKFPFLLSVLIFIKDIFTNKILSILLALLGIISLTVTGLLGGIMVYGTSADPLATLILRILGIHF
jgi:uncharacterized membrane protein